MQHPTCRHDTLARDVIPDLQRRVADCERAAQVRGKHRTERQRATYGRAQRAWLGRLWRVQRAAHVLQGTLRLQVLHSPPLTQRPMLPPCHLPQKAEGEVDEATEHLSVSQHELEASAAACAYHSQRLTHSCS